MALPLKAMEPTRASSKPDALFFVATGADGISAGASFYAQACCGPIAVGDAPITQKKRHPKVPLCQSGRL
jgi:hypothetical protein